MSIHLFKIITFVGLFSMSFFCVTKDRESRIDDKLYIVDTNDIIIDHCEIFLNNEKCLIIVRTDPENFRKELKEYLRSIDSSISLSYYIEPVEQKGITINISKGQHESDLQYFETNYDSVLSTDGHKLADFLNSNKISKDFFMNYVKFLSQFSFYSILKHSGLSLVEVKANLNEGYVYCPNGGDADVKKLYSEFAAINDSLYFFKSNK